MMPEQKPACPKCGVAARVRKGGVIRRTDGPVQFFRCGGCIKSFVDPANRRDRPGPKPRTETREQAASLRRAGLSFKQIAEKMKCTPTWAYHLLNFRPLERGRPVAGMRFEIIIRPQMVRPLAKMFQLRAGDRPDGPKLNEFCSEILESEIASFIALSPSLDLTAFGPRESSEGDRCKPRARNRLTPAQTEAVRSLREAARNNGERFSADALAKRFNVGATTIRRALSQEAANGN